MPKAGAPAYPPSDSQPFTTKTREARLDEVITSVVRWHEAIAAMIESGGEGATANGHRSIARDLVAAQVEFHTKPVEPKS